MAQTSLFYANRRLDRWHPVQAIPRIFRPITTDLNVIVEQDVSKGQLQLISSKESTRTSMSAMTKCDILDACGHKCPGGPLDVLNALIAAFF